jgi:hypothetical protein
MTSKKKRQFAALILAYLLCFSLPHCSKQEQTQSRPVEEEQKSLAESQGQSSGGGENQSSNTDESLSSTAQDSFDDAFEPIPVPFGFIHQDSIKYYSKTFVREAFFDNNRHRDVSQERFSKDYDDWVRHEFFLNLPDWNLIFAKHWWHGEIDIPTGVVTFWQTKGDSLQFIPLEEKSYLDFYGRPTIADSMSYADGALVLVLNGGSGDAGDVWGYYDILRFQKNKPIEHLSHEDYEYSNGFDTEVDSTDPSYTTLKYEIVREEKSALKVRYIRDAFADMRDGNDRLVKSDTTYAILQ